MQSAVERSVKLRILKIGIIKERLVFKAYSAPSSMLGGAELLPRMEQIVTATVIHYIGCYEIRREGAFFSWSTGSMPGTATIFSASC